MYNRTPQDDTDSERLLHIVLEPASHSGDYRHLRATLVRRAVASHLNPDTLAHVYGDGSGATGYRCPSWSSAKPKAFYVESLTLRAQMNITNFGGGPGSPEGQRCYGSEVAYRDCYTVSAREASAMCDTFKRLRAAQDKLSDSLGGLGGEDFADHCLRLAHIMGIKFFLFNRKDHGASKDHGTSLDDKRNFYETTASSVKYEVGDLIASCYPAK